MRSLRVGLAGLIMLAAAGLARGQSVMVSGSFASVSAGPGVGLGLGHGHMHGHGHGHGGVGLGGGYAAPILIVPPIWINPYYPYALASPAMPAPVVPPLAPRVAEVAPMPVRAEAARRAAVEVPERGDPERAKELVTMGDNLFRRGNLPRAEMRYEQAARADADAPAPRLGLEQVALRRGDYAEAAARLREVHAADPGWVLQAPDVQGLYAEPATFHKTIADLESYLQVHPHDRDAWLVLGAQWFLSGRTRKASDVFLRLTDRRPDPTLAAFLDASNALPPRDDEAR